MTQGIQEQIGTLPSIEAKLHLFQIGSEMLGAESVPRSHDSALEKRECRFDGVGVNVPHDIDAAAMLDSLVVLVSSLLNGYRIRGCVVGHNHIYIFADIFADELRQCSGLRIARM